MGPYSNITGVFIRRGETKTDTQGEHHVAVSDTAMGKGHLQNEEHRGLLTTPEAVRGQEGFFLGALGESMALQTP